MNSRQRQILVVLLLSTTIALGGWLSWLLRRESDGTQDPSTSVVHAKEKGVDPFALLNQGAADIEELDRVEPRPGVTVGDGYFVLHPFHFGSIADRHSHWMYQTVARATSLAPPHVSFVFWQDDPPRTPFGGGRGSRGGRQGGRRFRDPWSGYGGGFDANDRRGIPRWEMNEQFEYDVFRFVRLQYSSWGGRRYHPLGRWATDYPDSDLNLSFRLQQLTAIRVNPDPLYVAITDEKLFDYPFVYMIEPGALYFDDLEIAALRKYLLNGGFLMVDDFWGTREYDNFYSEIKRVFPDREPEELPLSHRIFHYVYDLKEKPQVPSIHHWRGWGDSSERGYDSDEVHYKAIKDDQGRIMVLICHNTDLGDGWEREGESREYFQLFSEKRAYPMGINIIVYAMTH